MNEEQCVISWMLQCVAVCCSVLQCIAVCCSVLRIRLHAQKGPRCAQKRHRYTQSPPYQVRDLFSFVSLVCMGRLRLVGSLKL